MQPEYDCIIMGGGPAGSTTATLLADSGHRVLVLERATFPRFHVGESLIPETYSSLKRLGMLEKLSASHFPRKESVQFVSASGKESQPFYFTDYKPDESSVTWQVRRDEFDTMMLDNAREHGAEVRQGVAVRRVVFTGSRAVGVAAVADGRTEEITAKVIVDATGQSTLLAGQLGMRRSEPNLKKGAIYAHFKGAHRDTGRNEGATIILNTPDRRGWFWYIPLPDDVVSVGVVGSPSYLFTGRGDDPARTLAEEIADCPSVRKRLEQAEQITRTYVTSDFSYRADRVAGDGWVLVGDAFGFLDPIYSSGVMLALRSGEFAADAIRDALKAGDVSARRLGRFGPTLAAGLHRFRQLIYAFYDQEFNFSTFLRKHPHCRENLIRILIGDVFQEDVDAMFEPIGEICPLPAPMPIEAEGERTA